MPTPQELITELPVEELEQVRAAMLRASNTDKLWYLRRNLGDAVDASERLLRELRKLLGLCQGKHYCCSPNCPGYEYMASETAHPRDTCGAAAGTDPKG